ncbi:MAG: tRNA (cytidine(34)-2'-O)-methyltransferase [Betaproteobacteria bacterium]|nr:tRNA (cytidine(34)-2'-O)-methyltransferase [Betaproteobacteria bacterium]
MFEVVLYQPEIPPNTGNIIRLCANTGTGLHLVAPLGFDISDRQLRRAGLDYHESAVIRVHPHWQGCREALSGRRWFALTTKATRFYTEPSYRPGDVFVLGPETRGLPAKILAEFETEQRLRLPMAAGSRSLNLSNAAAVMVFEAWRQQAFGGAG